LAHRSEESAFSSWRTPTREEAGARVETLFTKDGQPATTGQRAYRLQPDGRSVLQSVTLNQQVAMWPTPQARDYRSPDLPASGNFQRKIAQGFTIDLNSVVQLWPTPAAQDSKNATLPPSQISRDTPPGAILRDGQLDPDSPSTDGKSCALLNPRWVAQLQGFPSDWLDGIEWPL